MPEVTVVIPTRDRAALLARTLRSVCAQQDVGLELIVVDDGSTDETPSLLAGLAEPRLRVVRNEQPQGVAAARNCGIEAAAGEWVALIDDDDLWAPDKLARQLFAARESGAPWAYCGFVQVDPELRVTAGGPPQHPEAVRALLPFRNALPAGSSVVLARRSLLEQVGKLDPSLHKLEDWDLWIRLAEAAAPAWAPEPLAAYVEHEGMASLVSDDLLHELDTIEERYSPLRQGRRVDRVAWYRWMGWSALRAGSRRGAVAAYARAVRAGDATSVARGAIAVASPALGVRMARRHLDAEWASGAELWLRAHRADSVESQGSLGTKPGLRRDR